MAYSIEQNSDSLILSFIREPDGSIMVDLVRSLDKAMCLLDALDAPAYLVIDFSRTSLDLNDILKVSSTLALGPSPVVHHRSVLETLFVSADPSIRLAMTGLTNPAFGSVKLAQFDTLNDALAYCHDKLGVASRV